MAVTKGHGNPRWTEDEVVLALNLYFELGERPAEPHDERVIALSHYLRSLPGSESGARRSSYRNPDGVCFKLQNLRSVATGRGLKNVARIDRVVWDRFGSDRAALANRVALIKQIAKLDEESHSDESEIIEFSEGRLATRAHIQRERSPELRKAVLNARKKNGKLRCDLCAYSRAGGPLSIPADATLEVHHIRPLSDGFERKTKLADTALLCANCHKLIHFVIAKERRWLSLREASEMLAET